jgi:ribonucleoside-diphosphate reductase alpha chain
MERSHLTVPRLPENALVVQEKHYLKKDLNGRVTKTAADMFGGKHAFRKRPFSLYGTTYRMLTGCGPIYITINEDDHGLFELFTNMGKAGGCAATQSEAIGRLVSLLWRSSVQPEQVVKQLLDISCHSHSGFGKDKILSCADAVARAIRIHMSADGNKDEIEKKPLPKGGCPECGGRLFHEGGCSVCRSCGFSECS